MMALEWGGFAGLLSLLQLTGTLVYNGAVVNVISNTCAFPAATSQNICCDRGLYNSVGVPH